jgi:hypothetical protein
MKGILASAAAFLLTLSNSHLHAEQLEFPFEQSPEQWAFQLDATGQALQSDERVEIRTTSLTIKNNPKHQTKKWVDYIRLDFAYRKPDGAWNIVKTGTPVMVNRILAPNENLRIEKPLSATLEVPKDKRNKYWAVITLGTNDGSTIYTHSREDLFGPLPAIIPSELSELDLRESLEAKSAQLFEYDMFEALDHDAKDYLENARRTSSGLWYLTLFDTGIMSFANSQVRQDQTWDELEEKAKSWIKANPNSAAAHVTYAKFLIQHAWQYRSKRDGAEIVKGWLFNHYIEKAQQALEASKKIASSDPRWYEAMFLVATAQNWEEEKFLALEQEGFSRFPYYYQMYFVAFDYHSPRWNGGDKQIEEFANRAITYTAEKDGRGMYARVYWYASQRYYGSRLFTNSAVTWGKMSDAINDVLAQYPDQWNINNFAYFSCLAGDASKTKSLISRIQDSPLPSVWREEGLFERCRQWSAEASTGS